MKIKNLKFSLVLVAILVSFISCGDDDDDNTVDFEIRDRTEQQVIDKDSIISYLTTHYYNSSFIASTSNAKYTDIVITELPQDTDGNYLAMPNPDENTLLLDAVDVFTSTYLEVSYEYYILRLNEGGGESPKFTDAIRVRYEGSSVASESVFDTSITPITLSLQGNGFTTFGTVKGWQLVMPMFNSASDFTFNNGSVNYNDFGLGVMFIPSGLAYFAGSTTGISYDNLIFKFELLQMEELDHDSDGIPSYIEDLDDNLDVDDDDTDEDLFPDYIDNDDDADGVLTLDELIPTEYIVDTNMGEEEPTLGLNEYEISRSTTNGVIKINTVTIADDNEDGIPDYLDDTMTTNYNDTTS